MNKTKVKNFAVSAHKLLVEQIKIKAFEYEITDSTMPDINTNSVHSRLLDQSEKEQLKALIKAIKVHGYNHVIEEIAYTWFNRFIALRFMEINNFLPQKIRVFTNEQDEFKPDLLSEAIYLELDDLDKQKVFNFIDTNNEDGLYKYLLITLCNDMNQYLPELFTTFDNHDYTLLLLPDNLLKKESILAKLVYEIDKEDWKEKKDSGESTNAITMIGWLYQYYISERHNQVINILKGTVKKEDIPAATELFTTDWVVRYMVDNSLGRYWLERNPNSKLKNELKYLATGKDGNIPFVKDDPVKPEELTFFDPCMGSGHILSYAFDVLMKIYRECGWNDRDAAISIVENNLYGLDIDERAYQLAYFSIMMKGCTYNRRFLRTKVSNHLSNVVETNILNSLSFEGMKITKEIEDISDYLLHTFKDALELGSLIQVLPKNYVSYQEYIDSIYNNSDITLDYIEWKDNIYPQAKKLCKQADILSKKYCVTTTNPPYMSKMEGQLKEFIVNNYKECSKDLFAVFIKRNFDFTKENGYLGFMTPFVWMFIKSYEKLREYIINNKSITSLVQMEYSAYEEATVPICSFILKNNKSCDVGYYFRLSDFKGGMEVQKNKVLAAIENKNCGYFYEISSSNFKKIQESPIAYWASNYKIFESNIISIYYESGGRNKTHNNPKYVRNWWEIQNRKKWQPYANGGDFRKWYGNHFDFVDWSESAKNEYKSHGGLYNQKYCGKQGVCWNLITSSKNGFRRKESFEHYSSAAPTIIHIDKNLDNFVLGFLNSVVSTSILKMFNPTMNTTVGNVLKLPLVIKNEEIVSDYVKNNILLSKNDWDSFEISWNFKAHPLVQHQVSTIRESYNLWFNECNERFNTLKSNEEVLNKILIDIYGLQDELDPCVEDKDVTVCKGDLVRDIKSFISYAVGCMFGRYSLDVEGLAYAGGEWDSNKYSTFIPDSDDIIPICDEEYFEDDILTRFIEFLRVVYGSDTLKENLQFIADALGGKGTPREVLRNYFLNDFFKDHCNTYQVTGAGKRPIYWLFDSGKKNGFKSLVYIHRYTPDLIARMRTVYIHPQQARYRTQIEMLQGQINDASSANEKVKLSKQLKKINEQLLELNKYEEVVHHWADKMEPMDLDDGVKVNYAKFQELLAKIK